MRWLTVAAVFASGAALVLHVAGGDWLPAAIVALALIGVRVALLARAVVRRRLPWTRLLLPAIVWIEGVGLVGEGGWELRVVTAIALELAFLAVAIHALVRREAVEHPNDPPTEARIATALEAIVPPRIARLAAVELVILGLAARFLAGGWRRRPPAGFTYHRDNGLRHLLPLLPLLGIGDVVLLELVVLPHVERWARIALHVVAGYGLVWLIGLYASARARPHRLVGERVHLYRGALDHVAIARGEIATIAPMPVFADAWKERAYKRASIRLELGAERVLEVSLRDGRRLLVGVDDPAGFTRAVAREERG